MKVIELKFKIIESIEMYCNLDPNDIKLIKYNFDTCELGKGLEPIDVKQLKLSPAVQKKTTILNNDRMSLKDYNLGNHTHITMIRSNISLKVEDAGEQRTLKHDLSNFQE